MVEGSTPGAVAQEKFDKAGEMRQDRVDKIANRQTDRETAAAERKQRWADRVDNVKKMGVATKELVVKTGKSAVEGKDKIADWIADVPAKTMDLLGEADDWADKTTDAWAGKLEGRVDDRVKVLGDKGKDYAADARTALEELKQAKRDAKAGVGLLSEEEFSVAEVLKALPKLKAAEMKVNFFKKKEAKFRDKAAAHKGKAKVAMGASKLLGKVAGVASFR